MKTSKVLRFIFLFVLLGGVIFLNVLLFRSFSKVTLEGKGDFTVIANEGKSDTYPSWFVFDGPGDFSGDVIVHNLTSDKTFTLDLYPTDYMPVENGDFGLRMDYEPRESVGAWTQLEKSSVMLAPGRWEKVSFTVHVPEDLPAEGLYAGGIIAQKTDPSADQPNVNIQTRVGTRIYVNYQGKLNTLLENIPLKTNE